MAREERIRQFAIGYYWEELLKKKFSYMNIEFEEISLIEEIIPYQLYIGYIKIKSLSEKNEFIETEVIFDKRGNPFVTCYPKILNSIEGEISGSKVLFRRISL
mgnify:CR=1 FL=1|jgi:hypothetical protein